MSLRQELSLKLQGKLSPQQIIEQELLQLNTLAMEQHLSKIVEENPALEIDTTNEILGDEEYTQDNTKEEIPNDYTLNDDGEYEETNPTKEYTPSVGYIDAISSEKSSSSFEKISQQIEQLVLSQQEKNIAIQIIGNLDEKGFLQMTNTEIADYLFLYHHVNVTLEHIERMRKLIQGLEPLGIASHGVEEYLLLQLKDKKKHTANNQAIDIAIQIIEQHFNLFSGKNLKGLQEKLKLREEQIMPSIRLIERLNPYPILELDNKPIDTQIVPDFSIFFRGDGLQIDINDKYLPRLRVKKDVYDFQHYALSQKDKQEAQDFIYKNVRQANYIIEAIKMRYQTLRKIATSIAEHQRDYFVTGDDTLLKPLLLKHIAADVKRDISTISRALAEKYIETDWGIKASRFFINASLKNEHTDIELTHHNLEALLVECIANEDKQKPYTDEELTQLIAEKGFHLSRRTILSYRKKLNIPASSVRRKMFPSS